MNEILLNKTGNNFDVITGGGLIGATLACTLRNIETRDVGRASSDKCLENDYPK